MSRLRGVESVCQQYVIFGKELSEETAPEIVWKRLAEMGFWKIPVPEILGGYGHGWVAWFTVLETFIPRYHQPAFCAALLEHACQLHLASVENTSSVHLLSMMEGTRSTNEAEAVPKCPRLRLESSLFRAVVYATICIETVFPFFQKHSLHTTGYHLTFSIAKLKALLMQYLEPRKKNLQQTTPHVSIEKITPFQIVH